MGTLVQLKIYAPQKMIDKLEVSRPKDCQEFRIYCGRQIQAVDSPDYTNPEVPEVYATFSVPLNLSKKNKTSLGRLFRKYSATMAKGFKPSLGLDSTSETWRHDKGMTPLVNFIIKTWKLLRKTLNQPNLN